VVRHGRGKKIIVGKYKRRKGFRKRNGHRQDFTEVLVRSILT
jgi:large subunit ribosomal protein L21